MQEMWVRSLGQEDPLEMEMAAYSSILAWKNPRTEEPVEGGVGWGRGGEVTVCGAPKSQARLNNNNKTFD